MGSALSSGQYATPTTPTVPKNAVAINVKPAPNAVAINVKNKNKNKTNNLQRAAQNITTLPPNEKNITNAALKTANALTPKSPKMTGMPAKGGKRKATRKHRKASRKNRKH